jgi:hypothetical protein
VGWLSAIAVLSPSTLLLSEYDCTLQVLTQTSAHVADSKLAGPVGELRVLDPPLHTPRHSTGIVVGTERRLIFVGCSSGHIFVHDADSGRRLTAIEQPMTKSRYHVCPDVALVDGVLVTTDQSEKCLRFVAIDAIPGLK